MKKIALIEPRSSGYHVYSKFAMPRVGLPLLGTIMRNAGYEVKCYCEDLEKLTLQDYWDITRSDLIGISTISFTAPRAYRLATMLRAARKPIVMGGVHANFMPEEALKYVDYVIRGEGDEAFLDLVRCLEDGGSLDKVQNLSFRDGGQIIHNPARPLLRDLNKLPTPDLSLVKGHQKMRIRPVVTSRGCPYDCMFCSVVPMFGRGYRSMSPERAVQEIAAYSPGSIFVGDDNLTADRERAKKIFQLMIERNLRAHWTGQVRVDVAKDPELLDLMKRSGCFTVYVGFESINEASLKAYNKRQSVEDIRTAIRTLHEHGIRIHGMFVLGSDADTLQTVHDTVKFAKTTHLETVQFMVLTPLPGTRLYHQLDSEGRIFNKNWSLYDGQHVVFHPKNMTAYELQKHTFVGMKKFYRWHRCLEALRHFQLWTAFLRYMANRLVAKWLRANRLFYRQLKRMASEATPRIDKLPGMKENPQ